MKDEVRTTHSHYYPFPQSVIRSRKEALEELSRPCGRFRPQQDIEKQWAAYIVERIDPLHDGQLFAKNGVPLNWQRLVQYLHAKGVIAQPRFQYRTLANDRPKVINVSLPLDHTSRKTDGHIHENDAGYGASMSPEEALSKTVGETLERYFLSTYTRESMPHTSYESLAKKGYNVLDIRTLNTFLPWQRKEFPEFDWNVDTPFHWTKGISFPSGKQVLIPSQIVFWNYRHSEEKVLAHATTSGSAGHFTREEAILSGLLENIERDGFLIYWLNHLSPPVLDVSLLEDPEINEIVEYGRRYRLDLTFLDTTSDIGIPSVTCVVIDTASEDGPIISVGSAAHFDIKSAILHSAVEALLVNNYSASLPSYKIHSTYQPFRDKSLTRDKRLSAWKGKDMAERFAFFTSGKKRDPRMYIGFAKEAQTPQKQLDYIVEEFKKRGTGYEIVLYEIQDDILKKLGFHVVRTIVPALFPLYLSEHAAPLDSKRLKSVPTSLGFDSVLQQNPWPHPFP